jgi:hypothetical protein
MTKTLAPADVVERVRAELRAALGRNEVSLTIDEVEIDYIKREDDWWYVSITAKKEPEKPFRYYEALAEVESKLRHEDLFVAIVPCGIEE